MWSLETERLRLRLLEPGDGPLLLAALNTTEFRRFVGDRGLASPADGERYLEDRVLPSYAEHGFGMYGVERLDDGVPVGICGLVAREGLDHPDLGFALVADYYRKGYGSEAASRVLRYAFEELALPRVLALTDPENTASIRTLEKIGFSRSGRRSLPGEMDEVLVFSASNR